MRNGLIVVSGCPRSGTSVCMDIQRVSHGEDKILGKKFPQDQAKEERAKREKQQDGETDTDYALRMYYIAKQAQPEREDDYKDMNPEGFWEMAFTVRGVMYQPQFKKLLHDIRDGKEYKICKVVSQGLMASDPTYIGKIIYMMRHPRAVAKSQERLKRGFNVTDPKTGEVKNALEDFKIHTPEMYISVTLQACKFFIDNPEIPVRFYHFEDLIADPLPILDNMQEFIGQGDYTKAKDIVQPKLNRSKHEDIEHTLWEDAEFIYKNFTEGAKFINNNELEKGLDKFKEILEFMSDPMRPANREKQNWPCYRAKRTTNEVQCQQCYNDKNVMNNFKKHAISKSTTVDEDGNETIEETWRDEPCAFECGLDLDRTEYLTVEESIKNNFWDEDKE